MQDRPPPRRGAGDLSESKAQAEAGIVNRDLRISGFEDFRILESSDPQILRS
jgi:hypothetical protein